MSNLNDEQLAEINKMRQDLAIRDAYLRSRGGKRDYIKHYIEDNFGPNGFYGKMNKFGSKDAGN